jgi:imidazolonepropionase-like amidohydrolase
MRRSMKGNILLGVLAIFVAVPSARAQLAVKADLIYTMAGPAIENGMIVIRDGKIAAIGGAADVNVPADYQVLEAAVVTPGLVDAHSTIGLSGIVNVPHDRDQIETSSPIQPELRALDAYNPRDGLIDWVRGFGVTTVQTGHAPGELVSGQLMIVKTRGDSAEEAAFQDISMVAATLATSARKTGKASPGTRGKMMSLLRAKLIKAQEYAKKRSSEEDEDKPERDLALEALSSVLRQEIPLLITAQRAQDIANALRLAEEFELKLILDGAAESYLLTERIKDAGVPVILHPSMARSSGDLKNLSFETASILKQQGIPFAIQSGYEGYVPKARVVLFEAAIAAANGLSKEEALASITVDAAKILGVESRVGSLAIGMDGDLALYDGDPLEYTSHCIGTIIEGVLVSEGERPGE